MIVKMRKYSFLIYHRQYSDFLEKIREAGVLHVKEKTEGIAENDALREKMQLASRINNAMQLMKNYKYPENIPSARNFTEQDGVLALAEVESLQSKREAISQRISLLDREIDRMSVFGDYSFKQISELEQSGLYVRLFSCQLSRFKPEWETEYELFEIVKDGGSIYFALILREDIHPVIDAEPVHLNESNFSELKAEQDALREEIAAIEDRFVKMAPDAISSLKELMDANQGNIDWIKVNLYTTREAEEKVMVLEGFCPVPSEENLLKVLKQESVYFEATDPDVNEDIPVKLKNNSYSKLFEPITELFSLPNYGELDPTPFLAPFFMLFFGLCLGDGGYGLIVLAVATWLKPRSRDSMRGLLTLGQYLGGMTVIVGLVTGSFFGVALDQLEWKWLSGVKQLFLTESNYGEMLGGYNPMMLLAVVIGVIQILFGMIVRVMKVNKQHGFAHAASHLAWVILIVSGILYLGLPAAGVALEGVLLYVLYGVLGLSALVILFYNSPGKNIFSNVGSALWNTYNMATGLLGDTLSYIRLFALGLTGSILGGVFNTLAFDLTSGVDPFARWFLVLLILLVGHTINFGLCLIGAFVHPIRLTFVEFYKNTGFEGGGKAYKPFKTAKTDI